MNKQIKTKLLFILAGFFLVTFAVTGCNEKKEVKTEKTEKPAESKMDSANVAPGNDAKPQ